jgi:hypothetical protein
MEKFKYFTYGYPEHTALPVYGLYQPVIDCFLITVKSPMIASQLRMLLSSRYSLYTVCLNTAENYKHNLIDNAICENWTFRGRSKLLVDQFDKIDHIILADYLEPINYTANWNIDQEKQWCMLCKFYLSFFDAFRSKTDTAEKMLSRILPGTGFNNNQSTIEQQVLSLMYLGTDFDQTDQDIRKIIDTDPATARFFDKYYT